MAGKYNLTLLVLAVIAGAFLLPALFLVKIVPQWPLLLVASGVVCFSIALGMEGLGKQGNGEAGRPGRRIGPIDVLVIAVAGFLLGFVLAMFVAAGIRLAIAFGCWIWGIEPSREMDYTWKHLCLWAACASAGLVVKCLLTAIPPAPVTVTAHEAAADATGDRRKQLGDELRELEAEMTLHKAHKRLPEALKCNASIQRVKAELARLGQPVDQSEGGER